MAGKTSKVSSTRVIRLAGIVDGRVVILPLYCVRKNCIRTRPPREAKKIKSGKYDVLGMISHPTLYKCKTAPYITAWCHPYRNPEVYLDGRKPRLLLSESDFIDPKYVIVTKRPSRPKWDYFFITMGGEKAARRKGMNLFLSILPFLCANNLKGLVINYTRKSLYFKNRKTKRIWKRAQGHIEYWHKKISPRHVAEVMASCRFGLFPNAFDCSPLLIGEALIRDTPILVNHDILGGWKYVKEDTGVLFTVDNIGEAIDKIATRSFGPREGFMSEYGFHKSAQRFAEFGREHLKSFKGCELSCFAGLSHLLSEYV